VTYVDTGDVGFEARDLVVTTRRGKRLLDGISFTVDARSLLAVVGPSGSGNTTLRLRHTYQVRSGVPWLGEGRQSRLGSARGMALKAARPRGAEPAAPRGRGCVDGELSAGLCGVGGWLGVRCAGCR
jgi:hypothetical protein